LTVQLLTFSRGGTPVKKLAQISDLLQEATIFSSRGSNIKCQFDIPVDLWPVEVDEGQISQVMSNLVINGCQAMPNGGTIEITARNMVLEERDSVPLGEGRYLQVAVKDYGTGIPEEHLPKIFDPYFSTKTKGSGLGLAVVFSIIKRHGGFVEASSQQGHGTVFTFYLPAADSEVHSKQKEKAAELSGRGRILVMDDEEIVREITKEMLAYIGYQVSLAGDGAEAIRLYQESLEAGVPFDVVIMDLTVPGGMGGSEAIEELLQLDDNVKAVVSSGYSNDPVMANFLHYGFKGVVAKPYMLQELSAVLQRVCANC
jgi:two-component system, cell cycle sensor histidine kinase and response regulator CckA